MPLSQPKPSLLDLPTEVLIHTLTPFSTQELLPLVLISRQIHRLILRILHYRLLLAADNKAYKILLEAYHPSRRYTRPYLFCTYLGTDGLSSRLEGEGRAYETLDRRGPGRNRGSRGDGVVNKEMDTDDNVCAGKLGYLSSLYSRFRPEYPDVEGTIPSRRIAGATPVLAQSADTPDGLGLSDNGWNQSTPARSPVYRNAGDGGATKVAYSVNLDGGEAFGQFCAYAQLVRMGPIRGVFDTSVNLVDPGRGTIRVWRWWLMERIQEALQEADAGIGGKVGADVPGLARSSTTMVPEVGKDGRVLWTDSKRNVGLRVIVRQTNTPDPKALDEDDEPLYCEVQLTELVVRTTHLLLAVEESVADQKKAGVGKALIFGNFAVSTLNNGDRDILSTDVPVAA